MTVTAYRGLHGLAGLAMARKTPAPGHQGRPGTPTIVPRVRVAERPPAITGMVMNGTLATPRIASEPSQSRGDLMRERYQALEELQRSKSLQRGLSRPTMLSAVRSFSYELPTQMAEMERMSNQRTSPPPSPSTASASSSQPLLEPGKTRSGDTRDRVLRIDRWAQWSVGNA